MNQFERVETTVIRHYCKLCGAVIKGNMCTWQCELDDFDHPRTHIISRVFSRVETLLNEVTTEEDEKK